MTTAKFRRYGNAFEVTVTGHAGFADDGEDIVCASCSILTYTLLQSLLEMEAEGALTSYHEGFDDGTENAVDGKFRVTGEAAAYAADKLDTVLGVISAGFALLQEEYPDCVQLDY